MGVNNAENSIYAALVNEVQQLRRDFNEFRTTPQPIGNGSIKYAVFDRVSFSGATIGPDQTAIFTVTYMKLGEPFYYEDRPAIPKPTLLDTYLDLYVDSWHPFNHYPDGMPGFGNNLTPGMAKLTITTWKDMVNSDVSAGDWGGYQKVMIQVHNRDTASHTYYLEVGALIPRPALYRD